MPTLQGFRQLFKGSDAVAKVFTVTENGGQLPSDTQAFLFFYENGVKLSEPSNYTVSGSTIILTFDPILAGDYELVFWADSMLLAAGFPDCLDKIIGLSQTTCTCYDPKAASYNVSKSGLFLDELQSIAAIADLDNCEADNVWTTMERSRSEGTKVFLADMKALALQQYELKRPAWKGQIGQGVGRNTLDNAATYAGIRLACAPIRGGTIKIKKIGLEFNATGTINLEIYNNLNVQVANLTGLNTTANVQNINDITDIELPLLQPYSNYTEYFFVFTYDSGNKPKLNKIGCGCGNNNQTFNINNPYYNIKHRSGASAWANWVMVASWQGNTLTDFDCQNVSCNCGSTYMNGITLDVEFKCNMDQVLCSENFDFDTQPLAMSTALAVRYRTAIILLDKLRRRTNLTRTNMINAEQIEEDRRSWIGSYNEMVSYIASNLNLENVDCLGCKSAFEMQVKSVLT